ncbi:hypothetical protein UGMREWDR_CDS0030 [Aeromonas phage GomatiRiver_11]|nr:hypothetical protein UGMREWDR_CDS0030 [Aeromonas phage GomatiRiver_11]
MWAEFCLFSLDERNDKWFLFVWRLEVLFGPIITHHNTGYACNCQCAKSKACGEWDNRTSKPTIKYYPISCQQFITDYPHKCGEHRQTKNTHQQQEYDFPKIWTQRGWDIGIQIAKETIVPRFSIDFHGIFLLIKVQSEYCLGIGRH